MTTTSTKPPIIVLYDGACPTCVKDRQWYERLVGYKNSSIKWFDLNQHPELLSQHNIDTVAAISELHLVDGNQTIIKEIDAYIILLSQIWWLKPLAWLIQLPAVKTRLSKVYQKRVQARLKRTGRL